MLESLAADFLQVAGDPYLGSLSIDQDWIKKMEKSGYVKTATTKTTAFYYNKKER